MAAKRWSPTQVDELIRRGVLALNDGYRVRNVELGKTGIPFVRGGDIGDGDISTAVEDHVLPEFADRVRSKLTQPYDVAFITKGTVGRVGLMRPGQPPSVFAPQVCYWRSLDRDRLDPRFLFYLLKSDEFQANLDAVKTHGSMAADYVSLSDQRHFNLTIPPPKEQKAIARILGTLDDKIELNRRMNATLEAMARALFQSWFVDFDPVHAKAAGLPPSGMDAATAALFPASFDSNGLPEGWRLCTVNELCEINSWTLGKKDELDELEYVEISEVSRGDIANISTYKRGDEPSRARRRLRHGDTSPSFACVFNSPDPALTTAIGDFVTNDKRLLRICLSGVAYEFKAREIVTNVIGRHLLNMARAGAFAARVLEQAETLADEWSAR
jgi:type I restriction enzyme S subunit